MSQEKFIKQLQNAHAGEIGAYYAYGGHWKAVSDPAQREMIRFIQKEELEHIRALDLMLYILRAAPNQRRDTVFTVIGKTLGYLCKWTGYFMPMWGAMFMEKIGVSSYKEMSIEASKLQWHDFAVQLGEMHQTELDHEEYFKSCMK